MRANKDGGFCHVLRPKSWSNRVLAHPIRDTPGVAIAGGSAMLGFHRGGA